MARLRGFYRWPYEHAAGRLRNPCRQCPAAFAGIPWLVERSLTITCRQCRTCPCNNRRTRRNDDTTEHARASQRRVAAAPHRWTLTQTTPRQHPAAKTTYISSNSGSHASPIASNVDPNRGNFGQEWRNDSAHITPSHPTVALRNATSNAGNGSYSHKKTTTNPEPGDHSRAHFGSPRTKNRVESRAADVNDVQHRQSVEY